MGKKYTKTVKCKVPGQLFTMTVKEFLHKVKVNKESWKSIKQNAVEKFKFQQANQAIVRVMKQRDGPKKIIIDKF